MKCLLVCMVVFALAFGNDEYKIVNINQGPVKGYKVPGLDVFAYHGIPYATTPTGRDKYKPPLSPPVWTEVFEATNEFVVCPQEPSLVDLPQSENCLVTSIYVPNTNARKLPVLVNVHGGAFQYGYGNWEAPSQLVNHKKNVIGVTFNYRLGPQGFLCLGTEDIPGNAGMKDQVALLRWVRDNIARFGGDPNDVTISGCSAGGVSVDLLALSKMANGLFKKVIGNSGANIATFAAQVDPTSNARDYAKRINYTGDDTIEAVEEFYKNVAVDQLFSASNFDSTDMSVLMSPCVERDLGSERFLDDTPVNILTSGNYGRFPMLVGFSEMEGLIRSSKFEEWKTSMNENFIDFLPADLGFKSKEEKEEISDKIKEFYFGDKPVSNDTIRGFIDYHTDGMFVVAIHRSLTLQVKAGNDNIFLHAFFFTDDNSVQVPHIGIRGANHCDQHTIVLDVEESKTTAEYKNLSHIIRDLWLNFIQTGHPTPDGYTQISVPQWIPAGENRSPCMLIGSSTIKLTGPYEEHRQKFWDDIYDRFHREPVMPYDF